VGLELRRLITKNLNTSVSDTLFCNGTGSRLCLLTRKKRISVVSGEHMYHLSWKLTGSETNAGKQAGFTCFRLFTCLGDVLEIPGRTTLLLENYRSACDDGLATRSYVYAQ
jgi:hypothetical protein